MDLLTFRNNVHSQYGEDGILEQVFKILEIAKGACVEFGAWDGKHFSNTANLLLNKGWGGVMIEGSSVKFGDLRKTYEGRSDVILLNRIVSFGPPDNLDSIFSTTPLAEDFDLLSIDVDGCDYHIFDSVKKYHPKVVICEFNPSIPNCIVFSQARDMALNHGSSLLALVQLAKSKSYELVCCTDCNAIFVEQRFFAKFGIENNSIDVLHQDIRYQTWIVQFYDGTLKVAGCGRMIWHGVSIDEERIQMLPKEMRRFPDALR